MRGMILVLSTCTILLSACGGGGSDTGSNPEGATPSTGVFLDSAVEGLGYSTPSLSGVTNASGTFSFNAGETVTFTMYGQAIGQAPGSAVLTPLSLQKSESHPDYALNLLRLLQTMDQDGNPDNGIVLASVAGTMNLNFDQSTTDFEGDTAVASFIGARALVSAQAAATHFSGVLANANTGFQLDLRTLTGATVLVTSDDCPVAAGMQIVSAFTDTGISFSGTDAFSSTGATCFVSGDPSATQTATYAQVDELGCGPVCTYADLNRIVRGGTDIGRRTYNMAVSHVPGSKIITAVKVITADPAPIPALGTVRFVWSLDTGGYTLALAGRTATSTLVKADCPAGRLGGFTYAFTATGYSFSGTDEFVNCVPQTQASISEIVTYNTTPDFGLDCGPNCTFAVLNRIVRNQIDSDNRTYDFTAYHVRDSKTVTTIKRIIAPLPNTIFKETITLD